MRAVPLPPQEVEEHVCKHPYIESGRSVPSHCDVSWPGCSLFPGLGPQCTAHGCTLLMPLQGGRLTYAPFHVFCPSQGHNITLAIDGGSCTISHKDHSVTCHPPRVRLIKTPASCTKKHTTPVRVVGKECKIVKRFGDAKQGFLKPPLNKTVVLDFSVGRKGWDAHTTAGLYVNR